MGSFGKMQDGQEPDVVVLIAARRRGDGQYDVELRGASVFDDSGPMMPRELAAAVCQKLRAPLVASDWHDLGRQVVRTAASAVANSPAVGRRVEQAGAWFDREFGELIDNFLRRR